MSKHQPPSTEKCIEKKFSKALYKRLRKQTEFFKLHPELKSSAIDAFINSNGYQANKKPGYTEPGITITDLMRLLDLVERGVFTLDEIKDKVPKTDFRIMITMESILPGWTSPAEIVSILDESNIGWLRRVLFYTDNLIEMLSQHEFKHLNSVQAAANILDSGEVRTLEQINSIPGLRRAFEEFLKITEIHES
jgi:hypothetical protein